MIMAFINIIKIEDEKQDEYGMEVNLFQYKILNLESSYP